MVPFCYRYVPGRVVQNDRPSVQNDWPRSKQNRWPHSNQNHRPDHQIGRPNEPESTSGTGVKPWRFRPNMDLDYLDPEGRYILSSKPFDLDEMVVEGIAELTLRSIIDV